MAHLTEDEKVHWLQMLSGDVQAALADATARCEREHVCAACVAQVIVMVLVEHAAWFTGLEASMAAVPDEVYVDTLAAFRKALGAARSRTDEPLVAKPGRAVH